ncbi:MAG TPA: hypothetical protein DCL54_14715 [Alphaproteobacteria bacterium]|nr:hypothetical protein [Alphaproteobacteria bacterium]HAJ47823.1 hypothetical protein [Alphaproteobacteria bacterium]
MRVGYWAAIAAVALTFGASSASARNLYFDEWCADQGYDKARCEARNPGDVAAFEEYWRKVERYEEAYNYRRSEEKRWKDNLNSLDQDLQSGPGFSDEERRNRYQ